MITLLSRYTRWLHTRWPAGIVEKLPEVREDGSCAVPGVYIVGDLTGIPLLKFAADTGARAVQRIHADASWQRTLPHDEMVDLAIVGGGVAGFAAAMEAKRAGLRFTLFEATQPFSTLANFPKGKPIFTYPSGMQAEGGLNLTATVKEQLVSDLERQRSEGGILPVNVRIERLEAKRDHLLLHHADGKGVTQARRVIVAIGRSGNFRKLGVPGEDLPKVYNRLHDPKEFHGQPVLVVGGGDSALEAAIALAGSGAHVTLSYRGKEFSRPKPDNLAMIEELQRNPAADLAIESPTSERVTTATVPLPLLRGDKSVGSLQLRLGTRVKEVREDSVTLLDESKQETSLPNSAVFTMLGREAPLAFFRRSGIPIRGEWQWTTWTSCLLFFSFCVFLYLWKGGTELNKAFQAHQWFPYNLPSSFVSWSGALGDSLANPSTLWGTLAISLGEPGFYYTLAYSLCVVLFGLRRISRRKTPYITAQTSTLMAVQVIPLFLLPYLFLPLAGHNGWFNDGVMRAVADELFPVTTGGHGREFWRAFGFILAWPLFVWNVFTSSPLWGWLAISLVQTFIIIPYIVWRWGKGAYCGWICSCGALAETLGDTHRQKMPHGPVWNRLNMIGQVILLLAMLLLVLRIVAWTPWGAALAPVFDGALYGWSLFGVPLTYYFWVDIFLAGIVGVGLYFWFSGRVWCRFACPLAALMHVYARFSRFRIFADKSKCISCNVCTTNCHQGIDVMNFANKGLPMQDPECVRCSACVHQCPTGVLSFGQELAPGVKRLDTLLASPVQIAEAKK